MKQAPTQQVAKYKIEIKESDDGKKVQFTTTSEVINEYKLTESNRKDAVQVKQQMLIDQIMLQ